MGKGKPKISSKPITPIVSKKLNDNKQLVLSYKYLDLTNKKYSLNLLNDNRLAIQFNNEFNKKMQEYAEYENFKKYINDNGKYRDKNHIHPINWKDNRIRESCFTNLPTNLMEQISEECWQLGINNNGFRVHGFFIENVFYIVWLDPLHNLYAQK